MTIRIHLRNDIELPLGKAVAQTAHALNASYLDRMVTTVNTDGVVLTPTVDLVSHLVGKEAAPFSLTLGDEGYVKANAESPSSLIVDSGRTVFNAPTLTASWNALAMGSPVPEIERLPFSAGVIPCKQPIFVNRAVEGLTPEIVMREGARLSTNAILSHLDDMGNIRLTADQTLYQWLTNGFGKTCVGVKKSVHFERAINAVVEGEGLKPFIYTHEGQPAIATFAPIDSDRIEAYTRTKLTRLLDNL